MASSSRDAFPETFNKYKGQPDDLRDLYRFYKSWKLSSFLEVGCYAKTTNPKDPTCTNATGLLLMSRDHMGKTAYTFLETRRPNTVDLSRINITAHKENSYFLSISSGTNNCYVVNQPNDSITSYGLIGYPIHSYRLFFGWNRENKGHIRELLPPQAIKAANQTLLKEDRIIGHIVLDSNKVAIRGHIALQIRHYDLNTFTYSDLNKLTYQDINNRNIPAGKAIYGPPYNEHNIMSVYDMELPLVRIQDVRWSEYHTYSSKDYSSTNLGYSYYPLPASQPSMDIADLSAFLSCLLPMMPDAVSKTINEYCAPNYSSLCSLFYLRERPSSVVNICTDISAVIPPIKDEDKAAIECRQALNELITLIKSYPQLSVTQCAQTVQKARPSLPLTIPIYNSNNLRTLFPNLAMLQLREHFDLARLNDGNGIESVPHPKAPKA